jgi:AraC family transcriptional regulator
MQPVPIALGEFQLPGDKIGMDGVLLRPDKTASMLLSRSVDEQNVMPRERRRDDRGIKLAFQHLDIVLEIAGRDGRNAGVSGVAPSGFDPALADDQDDPVVARLSDALKAVEAMEGTDAEIHVDALRLAIVTRIVGLKGKPRCSADPNTAPARPGRRRRALQKWRLKRVLEYIDSHLTDKLTLGDLSTAAGLSRMHFASQFRVATGMRPHDYLLRQRIRRAEDLLLQTSLSQAEVAFTVGFRTQAHFTSVFKRFIGDTPYQWRSAIRMNGHISK